MKVRAIAFYLPQFHPIPENDEWWGRGFTEWTNVAKARPLFRGHYQPHLPADLGFYDLRVPEVREHQAELARQYGISGFCYWHYWFNGKRLLERPFQEVLESGKPDFPFCLGWANESWTNFWVGGDEKQIIKEQTYPGKEDYRRHFELLLPAFRDARYIRVEGKPLFLIYRPMKVPDCREALDYWRDLAEKNGLPGLHFVAHLHPHELNWNPKANGFDAAAVLPLFQVYSARPHLRIARMKQFLQKIGLKRLLWRIEARYTGLKNVYDYSAILPYLTCDPITNVPCYPMAIPNWDTTPRYGCNALVLHNSSPEAFRLQLHAALQQANKLPPENRIVFIKSWNEWAEGNHLEPDQRYGHAYLQVLQDECGKQPSSTKRLSAY